MAFEASQPLKATFIAGADLSTNAQYRFVKISAANTVVLCSAITDIPVGVLQNNPPSGGEAEVVISGITKINAAAAQAVPALIGTTATGQAGVVTAGTSTTVYTAGQYLSAPGGAGEIATALVDLAAPGRSA